MGYERDYEYGPLPTEPNGQPPVAQRKRCRGSVIARLGLIVVAACLATWAARQSVLQRYQRSHHSHHWEGHGGIACSRPQVISPAELKIQQVEGEYNKGKLIACLAPKDWDEDVKGPVRIPLPKITLPGDSVYFFDIPPRIKHREDEETSSPHRRPSWNTAGRFTLDVSDDVEEVTVKASIGVPDNGLFARVCTFEREDGAKGLGVVVPDEEPHEERLNYVKFAVQVPPKKFKSFETVLWNWTHTVGDIGDAALFRSFSLVGVNGNIHVESISAYVANATTINGNITGAWAAQDRLALATVNGRVAVDVDFKSTSPDDPASLSLHTTNGGVLASIALGTTGEFPGLFNISAGSIAAPVSVEITDAPVESIVNLSASSISAPVNATLHPTFEGTFDARTWGPSQQAEVHTRQGEEDPTGRGRKRTVSSHTISVPFGHGLGGEAFWGDELPESHGHVKLSTMFAPVSVVF